MRLRKLYRLEPSSVFCNIQDGQLFRRAEDGKFYVLLWRNINYVVARRWTWFDELKLFLRRNNGNRSEIANRPNGT
jgi:hypothetical protein